MVIKDFNRKDLKSRHGIYQITNTVNGKFYVGSAVNLGGRYSQHLSDLKLQKHANGRLQNAWNKYGEDSFVFSVLEFVDDKTKLRSEKVKSKMSESARSSDLVRANIAKVQESNKGRVCSEETKMRLREACRGKKVTKGFMGRRHTEETKQKIRDAVRGRSHTEEAKIRIIKANSVPVVQLSLSGDFITEFESATVASHFGFYRNSVSDCCKKGRLSKHKGYRFVYKNDYESLQGV